MSCYDDSGRRVGTVLGSALKSLSGVVDSIIMPWILDFLLLRGGSGRVMAWMVVAMTAFVFLLGRSGNLGLPPTPHLQQPSAGADQADTPHTVNHHRRIHDYQSPEYTGIEHRGESETPALSQVDQQLVNSLVMKQQNSIELELMNYNLHPHHVNKTLKDLVLADGGRPVRSLVLTTWRSGSTFIGELLNSHPATFYHYEPLLDFDIVQVRGGVLALQALHNLRHLLHCNYTSMDHYLQYGPRHPWLFSHNDRLWKYCALFQEICWSPQFLGPYCSLFPFQVLKTVRLRLNLAQELLEDQDLGVQVVLLVRDPRGTMQSRQHRVWCPGNPDCDNASMLCQDLVSDYHTAMVFRSKFPDSFRIVRYEDLSFNVENITKDLFEFFHLNFNSQVQKFLDTHTKTARGGVSSTFRDSKKAPIHWQNDLTWKEVDSIQRVCMEALDLWGYKQASDKDHLKSFMPVGTLNLPKL